LVGLLVAGSGDGYGAPPSVLMMSHIAGHVSVLELRFLILDDRPYWPVVQILADGHEAFVDKLPEWQGFDPADMLRVIQVERRVCSKFSG
jgi:hypothetical protein